MLNPDFEVDLVSSAQRSRVKTERYSRGKTAHTIFTWWARRPFSAMQSVLKFAVDDILQSRNANQDLSLTVADIFSGGATIPLAAATLGHKAIAVENNELAAFINQALLTYSQTPGLALLVQRYGEKLLKQLELQTSSLFPRRNERVIAYFWSRSFRCPDCNAILCLQKRPWLAKRTSRNIRLDRYPDKQTNRFRSEIVEDLPSVGTTSWRDDGSLGCDFCGLIINRDRLKTLWTTNVVEENTAFCISERRGKRYGIAPLEDTPSTITNATAHSSQELERLNAMLPDVSLPTWSGVVNASLYGISTYADLLNERQQAVMLTACRLLRDGHREWSAEEGAAVADSIVAVLSALIDQLADWNSRLCMWIAQNEQVGRGLSGPGLPMMWDYVEIDPLAHGPANLWEKLTRIVSGLSTIDQFTNPPVVHKADCRTRLISANSVDIVAIDPPYYDNLFYNVLADCIYVWKRIALGKIFPAFFMRSSTNSASELTACSYRIGDKKSADSFYDNGMSDALTECARILKPDGILAVVYAHSTVDGWASLLSAIHNSGFSFFSSADLQVERKRPRSMTANAVDTSYVFFGRPASSRITMTTSEAREYLSLGLDAKQTSSSGDADFAFGQLFLKVSQIQIEDEYGIRLTPRRIMLLVNNIMARYFSRPALVRRSGVSTEILD